MKECNYIKTCQKLQQYNVKNPCKNCNDYQEKRPNFYLVCGISGGGKTILSKQINRLNPGLIVMDVDEYYAKRNGDETIHENSFDVWYKMMFPDLHEYEKQAKDVLFTTNALTVAQRRVFIDTFPGFKHHCLWVISPKEKCFEGNKSRKRHVPDEILEEHWYKMEFPNPNEPGWETITHITNCWGEGPYLKYKVKGDIESIIRIQ